MTHSEAALPSEVVGPGPGRPRRDRRGSPHFISPEATALVLVDMFAARAIAIGVLEISAAIRLRKEIDNEVLLGLSGIVSIALGALLVLFPGAGAVSLIWMLGAYALVFGVILIARGLRLRTRASASPRTA